MICCHKIKKRLICYATLPTYRIQFTNDSLRISIDCVKISDEKYYTIVTYMCDNPLSQMPHPYSNGIAPTKLYAYLSEMLPKKQLENIKQYYNSGEIKEGISSKPTIAWEFSFEGLGDYYRWCNKNKMLPIYQNRSIYLEEISQARKFVKDKKYLFDYCSYLRDNNQEPNETTYNNFCLLLDALWIEMKLNREIEEKLCKERASCDFQSLQEWLREVIDDD